CDDPGSTWLDRFRDRQGRCRRRTGRGALPVWQLVYRRRCHDRLHVYLEADVGRATGPTEAGGLCGSSAGASRSAQARRLTVNQEVNVRPLKVVFLFGSTREYFFAGDQYFLKCHSSDPLLPKTKSKQSS